MTSLLSGEVSTLDGFAMLPTLGEAVEEAAPQGPEFTLLGAVAMLDGGRDVGPTAPKALQVLAMLLARVGRMVPSDSLVREVWGDDPPASARRTLQTYIYQLRRCLGGHDPDAGRRALVTRPFGYVLDIGPDRVDATRFTRLLEQARRLSAADAPADAAGVARSALALWSGPPMTNVAQGPWLSGIAIHLLEQRRSAHLLYIDSAVRAGRAGEVLGEVRSLAAANPLDEGLHARLMRALGATGRREDALLAYHRLRAALADELGVEPGRAVTDLYRDLIAVESRGA